jgi:hypothetical protein
MNASKPSLPSFPRIMTELPIVEWLTEGSVPRELDDRLPIVKARTRLDLRWVQTFVPPEYFYHAVTQHRHGNGSKWKDGYVGDKQHISIQTSLFPNQFASAHDFAAFIGRLVDDVGPINDLVVKGALAWTPPPGCVENGDLNYRCVVLELAESAQAQRLRDRIRASIGGFDRFGPRARFHVTVAYVCDPADNEEATQRIADNLVHELNARYKGTLVPCDPPHSDDNGFPYFGSPKRLSDFVHVTG